MKWLKARLKENSTLLGLAVFVAMGGRVDLQTLQALQFSDLTALPLSEITPMVMAIIAIFKGDK